MAEKRSPSQGSSPICLYKYKRRTRKVRLLLGALEGTQPHLTLSCVWHPCGIAAADFAAKNSHTGLFFNAAHPLRGSSPICLHKYKRRTRKRYVFYMARLKGLEPLTYWFVASHSIQLSYKRIFIRAKV